MVVPYGKRLDRHARAGLSQTGSERRRAPSRMSSFVTPSSSSGAPVVGVEAVDHVWDGKLDRLVHGLRVHLGLAEVAPVDRVGGVSRVIDLIGFDQDVTRTELFGELPRGAAFLGCETGGDGGQRDGAVSELSHRLREQVARVHAAREADDDVAPSGEPFAELGDFLVQTGHTVCSYFNIARVDRQLVGSLHPRRRTHVSAKSRCLSLCIRRPRCC
jgi:hypothetical protein